MAIQIVLVTNGQKNLHVPPSQAFEWDVQFSQQGKTQLGWTTRDEGHLNISLDGMNINK